MAASQTAYLTWAQERQIDPEFSVIITGIKKDRSNEEINGALKAIRSGTVKDRCDTAGATKQEALYLLKRK